MNTYLLVVLNVNELLRDELISYHPVGVGNPVSTHES